MKPLIYIFILFLLMVPESINCQDFSTLGEIYDFDPGDEFYYVHLFCCNENMFHLERIQILNRELSDDHLRYVRNTTLLSVSRGIEPPVIFDTIHWNKIDTVQYGPVDSIIFDSNDTVLISPYLYNGRKTCIKHDWILNDERIEKYVDGCGLVFAGWNNYPESSCTITDSLCYFDKGFEIWGTKILSSKDRDPIPMIKLFPNPVGKYLNITSISRIISFSIIDISGKSIISNISIPIYQQKISISCETLEKGIYFINFITLNGSFTRKFIKK